MCRIIYVPAFAVVATLFYSNARLLEFQTVPGRRRRILVNSIQESATEVGAILLSFLFNMYSKPKRITPTNNANNVIEF